MSDGGGVHSVIVSCSACGSSAQYSGSVSVCTASAVMTVIGVTELVGAVGVASVTCTMIAGKE